MASPADAPTTAPESPAAVPVTPAIRSSLSLVPPSLPSGEALIQKLALDRLRELRDDGVTMDYIGRMYEVSGERIRALEDELRQRIRRT